MEFKCHPGKKVYQFYSMPTCIRKEASGVTQRTSDRGSATTESKLLSNNLYYFSTSRTSQATLEG